MVRAWMMRLAVLNALVLGALAVGCGEGSGAATSTAVNESATAEARAVPTATPVLRDLSRLTPELRSIVDAAERKDVDALAAMIAPRQAGCVELQQEGSPPQCEKGEAPGTPVDVFLVMGCGGGDVRLADGVRSIKGALEPPLQLYALFKPSTSIAEYRIVFVYTGVDTRNGFVFDATGGRITGLHFTCMTVVDATRYVAEFLVPPRYGPHATAPRHLMESAVAEFVPTPYNTFVVTGTFDHVIDEAGAGPSFAWDVPGNLTYNGKDIWWRVYWDSGEVFDCAQSCTSPLTTAEASARLDAMEKGTPVCVVGWTDDVGGAQSELVYLHAPERCPVPDGYFSRPTAPCLLDPRSGGGRWAMIDYPSREVYVTAPGGGRTTVITAETTGSTYAYTEPTLSPSGDTLVVGANLRQANGTFRAGLWSFDLSGEEPRLIYPTDNGQTFEVDSPAYSPDGTRIAFTRISVTWRQDHGHDDRYEVWVMDVDGSTARKVADGRRPHWSDSGAYIAYDTQSTLGATLTQALIDSVTYAPVPSVKIGPC